MTKRFKASYLELEQSLFTLRTHFEMCKGAENQDVLHWAKFFKDWIRKASVDTGPWWQESLAEVEKLIKDLEKPKTGDLGYEILDHMMSKASWNLNREILESLPVQQKAGAPAGR